MTGRADQAEQTRRRRLAFEQALRDGTSVVVASTAAAKARWEAADQRLAAKRCGTADLDEPRPLQWWQR